MKSTSTRHTHDAWQHLNPWHFSPAKCQTAHQHQFKQLCIAAALVVFNPAWAQSLFPVAQPVLQIGDAWTGQTTDLWNNTLLRTSDSTYVATESDRSVFRGSTSTEPAPVTFLQTKDRQNCRSMQGSTALVCAQWFAFPMTLGQKTKVEKSPFLSGEGFNDATCEVMAEEKVTVPAGTFDAVRIDCKGFWNRVFNGSNNGPFTQKIWYAPAVKAVVRQDYEDRNRGAVFNKNRFELTAFVPAK